MIYIDSSVVLARLLVETRMPLEALFDEDVVASRLLEYEVWNRIHAGPRGTVRDDDVREVLAQIDFFEMSSHVLARALRPFPVRAGTLDSLHLATIEYLRAEGETVELASHDRRLIAGAEALGIPRYVL